MTKKKNGYVITFGRIMCSASMNISATMTDTKTIATKRNGVNPICQNVSSQTRPVSNSTAGYRNEIGALHARHFPPSSSQLRTGMLSYGLIEVSHFGHFEFGNTIDSPFGTRW